MVVFGVDEGDVEAGGMKQLGHCEHRCYVALCWVRHAHRMGFAVNGIMGIEPMVV